MPGPEQCRDGHEQVAAVKAAECAAGEQPCAGERHRDGWPHDHGWGAAHHQPNKERREHDVERSEKACIRRGCGDDADLLERGATEEYRASENRRREEPGRQWFSGAGRFVQRQRRQCESGDDRAGCDEKQRPDVIHRRLLKHERDAPDDGGEDEQQIGVNAAHGRPRDSSVSRGVSGVPGAHLRAVKVTSVIAVTPWKSRPAHAAPRRAGRLAKQVRGPRVPHPRDSSVSPSCPPPVLSPPSPSSI